MHAADLGSAARGAADFLVPFQHPYVMTRTKPATKHATTAEQRRSQVVAGYGSERRPGPRSGGRGARNTAAGQIHLRSASEIDAIRATGAVLYEALDRAYDACVVGATTASIDAAAMEVIRRSGAEALFVGYRSPDPTVSPFPACCCVSVNDEIVHGIPGSRVIRDGDLVSIDCGVRLNGWCADAAVTVPVGNVSEAGINLVESAQHTLAEAVRLAVPGERWSFIAAAMQEIALRRGHGVVVEYVGHGIGRELHEAPQVPNCLSSELLSHGDFTLRPGMVIAVEPMLTLVGAGIDKENFPRGIATRTLADGWTVVSADGSPAVHVEHTIAITRNGCDVLTVGPNTDDALAD